jgi:hypothetical protein
LFSLVSPTVTRKLSVSLCVFTLRRFIWDIGDNAGGVDTNRDLDMTQSTHEIKKC